MKKSSLLLSSLFIFLIAPQGLAASQVATYDQLVHAIREVRAASQGRIEAAVEQEKVREAWETGKLIDEHILLHKERAEYGKQVLKRLANDLGTSETELGYMLQFARAYPISRAPGKLPWSHYESLLAINDAEERASLVERAVNEKWSLDKTRSEVKKLKASKIGAVSEVNQPPLKEATAGKIGTYRIVKATAGEFKGELVLDLGFSNYYKPAKKLKFQDREIVTLEKGKLKKTGTEEDPFTYKAYVFRVIDGDTFYAVVSLGFGFNTVQKLRLRGLDAPEIESSEGKEARAFLERHLTQFAASVLIKTVRSDKYDRYLADVWAGDTYVNQELLDKGLAVRVSE